MVLITSVGYKISKSLEFTVAVLGTTATTETQQNRKVQKITLTSFKGKGGICQTGKKEAPHKRQENGFDKGAEK